MEKWKMEKWKMEKYKFSISGKFGKKMENSLNYTLTTLSSFYPHIIKVLINHF